MNTIAWGTATIALVLFVVNAISTTLTINRLQHKLYKFSHQLDRANLLLIKCDRVLEHKPLSREIFEYFNAMPRELDNP